MHWLVCYCFLEVYWFYFSVNSGVDINVLLIERIVADVYCSGDSIVEFVTSSPLYMNKSIINLVPGYTNKYYITLTWQPIQDQYGLQV
jgi:hypothetical protein